MQEDVPQQRKASKRWLRISSAILALILAIGCALVAIYTNRMEGPKIEAGVLAAMLSVSAFIALTKGSMRLLVASYGILIGVLVAWGEYLFLLGTEYHSATRDAGYVDLLGVLSIPIVGLMLALIA